MAQLNFLLTLYNISPKLFLTLIITLLISNIFEGIGIISLLPLIELTISNDKSWVNDLPHFLQQFLSNNHSLINLNNLLIFIITLFIMKFIFLMLALILSGSAAANTTAFLRMQLFSQLNKTKWNFFTKMSSGRISNCLVTEIASIGGSYNLVVNLLSTFLIIIIYLIISFITSPYITISSLVMSIITALILKSIISITKKNTLKHVDGMNSFMGEINENLLLLKSIKAMGIENKFLSIISKTFDNLKKFQKKIIIYLGALQIILEPIFVIFLVILVYFATLVSPENLVSTKFIFLIIIFYRIFTKVSSLQVFFQKLTNSHVYFESYNKLLLDAKNHSEIYTGRKKIKKLKSIEFKNVNFKYDDFEVLKNLSFKIISNKITTIVGPSGKGKTTILDLLSFLYKPNSGEIFD